MKESILDLFFEEIEVSPPKTERSSDIMKITAKPIAGCPGYEIFEDGSVWSSKSSSFLVPNVSGNSKYPKVNLNVNGRKKTPSIHRLVAEAFLSKPIHPAFTHKEWRKVPPKARKLLQDEYQVDHINGDHTDYHVDNLRWVTGKQNRDYYYTEQKYL